MKIFLFATSQHLSIRISKASKVGDLIKHIMTVYKKDTFLSKEKPLLYPLNPEAYELRLIDDEGDYFKPYYEVGALDRREKVGKNESLAFVQARTFKPKGREDDLGIDPKIIEELKSQNVSISVKLISFYRNEC